MTEMYYSHFLHTDLYSDPMVVRFVECLNSPEIDSAAEHDLPDFVNSVLPIDDILSMIEWCADDVENKIKKNYRIKPFFASFKSSDSNKKIEPITLSSSIPETKQDTNDLLHAGKCLAFSVASQAVFLVTECFHDDGSLIFGDVPIDAQWGICISGSSVQGNAFHQIIGISEENNEIVFVPGKVSVKRQKHCLNKMSGFFNIESHEEFQNIVKKLSFVYSKITFPEKTAIKNFAVILKSMSILNYNK